jgi:prophage tail gpP-like protein
MRYPRVEALAGGAALPGVIGVEIESRCTATATRFRMWMADSAVALAMLDDPTTQIAVRMIVDGTPAQLVLGRADTLTRDPLRGILDLEGRDLAALLIDSRPQELFVNQTASEIAASLAQAVGLTCTAETADATVGRLYGSERDRLALPRFAKATTAWDQLALLAAAEGLRVWVDGRVLNLRADDGGSPFLLDVSATSSVRLIWQPAIARGVEVVVASWGTRLAQSAEAQAGQPGGVQHRIVRPNLAQAEAQALATQAQAEVARHERAIEIVMPGELAMRAGGVVQFTGATGWDGLWQVASLRRRLNVREGFQQFVRLEQV